MRCLVIDDQAYDRETVARLVERAGHEAVPAGGAQAALDLIKSKPFDVALVAAWVDAGAPQGSPSVAAPKLAPAQQAKAGPGHPPSLAEGEPKADVPP